MSGARAEFGSRRWVGIVALWAAGSSSGCLRIESYTPPPSRQILSAHHEDRVLPERRVRVAVESGTALQPDGEALRLNLKLSSYRPCERTRTEQVEITTRTRNTVKHPELMWTSYLVGLGGAVIVGFSVADLAHDDPNNPKETENDGAAVNGLLWGGLASMALVSAVVSSFRAIDDEEVEETEVVSKSWRTCEQQPLKQARVVLRADGDLVGRQQTDAEGKVAFLLYRRELVRAPQHLSVEAAGYPMGDSPSLDQTFEHVLSRWHAHEAESRQASEAAPPPLTPAPSPGQEPQANGVKLFGVPLVSAVLEEFEAAARDAGCALLNRKNSNVAFYDARCTGLPGYRRMKVLSDGHQRVVKVEFSGEIRSQNAKRLIAAFEQEYGEPSTEGSTLSWELPGGIRLSIEDQAFDKLVVYTHVALHAALGKAVQRKEQERVESIRHQLE